MTGSGSSYTVSVNTGTGSGTLGLNLVDDDTIVDGLGNKLGGTGAGNGNFTGEVYDIDRSGPVVTGVSSSQVNGSYGVGVLIPVTVTFDEAVTVTGTPQLTLNSGGTASYASGSGQRR